MGIAEDLIEAEVTAMRPVRVARTIDRAVLGILVDFAKSIPYRIKSTEASSLSVAEDFLAETPCFVNRRDDEVVFPEKHAPKLLSKWRER
jgi:hypothetical protein